MSRHPSRSHRGDFYENSPRPPVPGEETVHPSNYQESVHAPYGYEPKSRCRVNYHDGTRSPPACLLWARNLHCLLADTEGVELFRMYLEQEGRPHADALNFWFACEGLKKQTDPDRINQLVKVIHRKFINTSTKLGIREELRREVTSRMRNGFIDQAIFDAVQNEVGKRISDTTYPNFLKSDVYLNFVQQLPTDSNSGSGSGSSSSSGGRDPSVCGPSGLLQTLHEDSELVVAGDSQPLTRERLAATQTRRALESRPRPEAFAGIYLQPQHAGPARAYSSYNPVSRQDSELQSISSGTRTDPDAASCTGSSMDGSSLNLSSKPQRHFLKQLKEMKEINRDTGPVIPRTQYKTTERPSTTEFLQQAAEKLQQYLLDQDRSRCLADMIRDKLQVDDVEDQSILDQHVSRVWSDDRTPCRSPGRPRSPEMRRKGTAHGCSSRYPPRYPRSSSKGQSTFSIDSGNAHDYPDCSESSRHFPKSKSVPESVDAAAGYDPHLRSSTQRRGSSSKKAMGELTDSGVSVVYDSMPKLHPGSPPERVKSWLKDTNAKMQLSCRHARRERSSSLERASEPAMSEMSAPHTSSQLEEARRRLIEDDTRGRMTTRPRFPVAGKPSSAMPSETGVSDLSTLKKTMRRPTDISLMQPSTSKSGPGQNGGSCASGQETTVMYCFGDEKVPYMSKLPGRSITLRQFKESLPKRGNYRYFFKRVCDEEGAMVILQEVIDDNEILPLWNDKIFAQVNPVLPIE